MKHRILAYLLVIPAALFCLSCGEDALSGTSVINQSANKQNEFDHWLDENFRQPFNIRYLYRYEHIESDMTHDLVPINIDHSVILAKMIKHVWLDAYVEAVDLTFLRNYSPRIIMLIGSASWNINGNINLGTAEGGVKVTLYMGNWLNNWLQIAYNNPADPSAGYTTYLDMPNLNYYYFHTMHHEFAHILHQEKDFPAEFRTISAGNYAAGTWGNRGENEAMALGFIGAYAGKEAQEDFVETFAYYVTLSQPEWEARVAMAGETGSVIIERKLKIVKKYMKESWGIDMDKLRSILARRCDELHEFEWFNF